MSLRNAFKTRDVAMSSPERQSMGILDDFAVRKVVSTREGTIEKVPVNSNDIVNKVYADSISVPLTPWTSDINGAGYNLNAAGKISGTQLYITGRISGAHIIYSHGISGGFIWQYGSATPFQFGGNLTSGNPNRIVLIPSRNASVFVNDSNNYLGVECGKVEAYDTCSSPLLSGANLIINNKISAANILATTISAANLSISGAIVLAYPTTQAVIIGDIDGNAKGNYAINLQSGRTNAANVASGDYCVALGYDTKADGGSPSTAVGRGSIASAGSSTAVGYGAAATGGITAANTCIGFNSSVIAGNQVVIGASSTANGNGDIVIGTGIASSGAGSEILLGSGGTNYLLMDGAAANFQAQNLTGIGTITSGNITSTGTIRATGKISGATLTAKNGFTGAGVYTTFTISGGIILSAS